MTGPPRTPPGASPPGENAQPSEDTGDALEWQSELDVAIADIDSRLRHPRRRATDTQPASGAPGFTTEVIDEIAWRVAELLRRDGGAPVQATAVAAAISKTVTPPAAQRAAALIPPPAPLPEPRKLPHGIALSIRIRKPFFRLPWPFRRRHRQRMIMFSDYRIS
ncbi:MAG: hypothetical protein K2Y23_20895 [Cyanobacteria bacterium]|nr:hypothetical protein [Cyanobacteriota bacterium]